jgi:hypothetical protein
MVPPNQTRDRVLVARLVDRHHVLRRDGDGEVLVAGSAAPLVNHRADGARGDRVDRGVALERVAGDVLGEVLMMRFFELAARSWASDPLDDEAVGDLEPIMVDQPPDAVQHCGLWFEGRGVPSIVRAFSIEAYWLRERCCQLESAYSAVVPDRNSAQLTERVRAVSRTSPRRSPGTRGPSAPRAPLR